MNLANFVILADFPARKMLSTWSPPSEVEKKWIPKMSELQNPNLRKVSCTNVRKNPFHCIKAYIVCTMSRWESTHKNRFGTFYTKAQAR